MRELWGSSMKESNNLAGPSATNYSVNPHVSPMGKKMMMLCIIYCSDISYSRWLFIIQGIYYLRVSISL